MTNCLNQTTKEYLADLTADSSQDSGCTWVRIPPVPSKMSENKCLNEEDYWHDSVFEICDGCGEKITYSSPYYLIHNLIVGDESDYGCDYTKLCKDCFEW